MLEPPEGSNADGASQPSLSRTSSLADVAPGTHTYNDLLLFKRARAAERAAVAARNSCDKNFNKDRIIQRDDFIKTVRETSNWGSSMQMRGREAVQPQAEQLARLCGTLVATHAEVVSMSKELRQSVNDLAHAVVIGSERCEALEASLKESNAARENGFTRLREEMVEQISSAVLDCAQSGRSDLEGFMLREQSARRKLQENLGSRLDTLDSSTAQGKDKLNALSAQLEELDSQSINHGNRHRDVHHRVDNAADHALRANDTLETVCSRLTHAEDKQKDIRRVAESVVDLKKEVQDLKIAGLGDGDIPPDSIFLQTAKHSTARARGGHSPGRAVRARAMEGESMPGGDIIEKIEKRLTQLELSEKEMLHSHELLERRVSSLQLNKSFLETVKRDIEDLRRHDEDFGKYVNEQLTIFRKIEMKHAMQNFRARWQDSCLGALISPLELFRFWVYFVNMRNKQRQALAKVKNLYAKRHVGSRMQSWNYVTQKCLHQTTVEKIESRGENVETQLETLSGMLKKREKASTDQAKEANVRMSNIEKRLETHATKKADRSEMHEQLKKMDTRFDIDFNPEKQKRIVEELWTFARALDSKKADLKMTEKHSLKIEDLSTEVRATLKKQENAIERCAAVHDLNGKADAIIIERVLVLFAQQSDQLARLVSADLNMFKEVLGRFLELSPDVRKAALSLGLQSNEQCVACRQMNAALIEPLSGSDGVLYRYSPDKLNEMNDETKRVIHEKLRFPGRLMSSLVVGCSSSSLGDTWAPVKPALERTLEPISPSSSSKPQRKLLDANAIDKAECEIVISQIRKIVFRDPGWLTGGVTRASTPQPASNGIEARRPENGNGRAENNQGVAVPNRPSSAHKLRSVVSGRKAAYFPAAAAGFAESAEAKRSS